jgi:hypothetical protein
MPWESNSLSSADESDSSPLRTPSISRATAVHIQPIDPPVPSHFPPSSASIIRDTVKTTVSVQDDGEDSENDEENIDAAAAALASEELKKARERLENAIKGRNAARLKKSSVLRTEPPRAAGLELNVMEGVGMKPGEKAPAASIDDRVSASVSIEFEYDIVNLNRRWIREK